MWMRDFGEADGVVWFSSPFRRLACVPLIYSWLLHFTGDEASVIATLGLLSLALETPALSKDGCASELLPLLLFLAK